MGGVGVGAFLRGLVAVLSDHAGGCVGCFLAEHVGLGIVSGRKGTQREG